MDKLEEYKQLTLENEKNIFSSCAAFSKNHYRPDGPEDDYRLPYKRDLDRILHSKAYARYADKTQVVYLVDNDHITHRNLHVQLVSNFARGIGEILRLNIDLVEAIALGHDVGHPPFGHEGEEYLSALSIEYDNGPFCHPLQSCRLFGSVEPLNLGLAVYDGFLCHDGGMNSTSLQPFYGKTWDDHLREREEKKHNPDKDIMPGTLEGCLVKLCDTISYLGRDMEDAISLGIISRSQVPETVLGTENRSILSTLAKDMIIHSYGKEFIEISKESYAALQELRAFNFKSIYMHPKLKVESSKIKFCYRLLFEWLLNNFKQEERSSYIWNHFLYKKSESYLANTTAVQIVIDYISGMTDHFFIRTIEKIILPKKIELFP